MEPQRPNEYCPTVLPGEVVRLGGLASLLVEAGPEWGESPLHHPTIADLRGAIWTVHMSGFAALDVALDLQCHSPPDPIISLLGGDVCSAGRANATFCWR